MSIGLPISAVGGGWSLCSRLYNTLVNCLHLLCYSVSVFHTVCGTCFVYELECLTYVRRIASLPDLKQNVHLETAYDMLSVKCLPGNAHRTNTPVHLIQVRIRIHRWDPFLYGCWSHSESRIGTNDWCVSLPTRVGVIALGILIEHPLSWPSESSLWLMTDNEVENMNEARRRMYKVRWVIVAEWRLSGWLLAPESGARSQSGR